MNIEELQLINRTKTANEIINFFARSKKISNEIILRFLKSNLMKQGVLVNEEEFSRFFKEAEEVGVGSHNDFNGQRAGRFVSKYILCDIAEQILNPNKKMEVRRVGTPTISVVPRVISPITSAPKKAKAATPPVGGAVVFIYKTLDDKYIPFPLNEVPRLVEQAELIRTKMG